MSVAPLGVSRYSAVPIEALDREGAELAAITHGHSLGYMPAAVLTHILHRIVYPERAQTLLQIVCEARDTVRVLFAGDKHLDELTARIDALYRRIDSDGSSNQIELKHGPFVLNTRNRTLDKEGRRIKLTQVEYAIVKLFMQNPARALSREDILAAVWGRDYDGELKIVDVNIRRLRIKIEDDTANPTYITTVWGFGYKWGA